MDTLDNLLPRMKQIVSEAHGRYRACYVSVLWPMSQRQAEEKTQLWEVLMLLKKTVKIMENISPQEKP